MVHEAGAWSARLPGPMAESFGTREVRYTPGGGGKGTRSGGLVEPALSERILLLARSQGAVTRLVAEAPAGVGRQWVRFHWRIRYGADELAEELWSQNVPVGGPAGLRMPTDGAFRAPSPEEATRLTPPDPERLAAAWMRGLRGLEGRIRRKLRPYTDRARRELFREMRTLSTHFRSLIAEERASGRKRDDESQTDRMLALKEDWERKVAAVIRQRILETEAKLVAATLLVAVPRGGATDV